MLLHLKQQKVVKELKLKYSQLMLLQLKQQKVKKELKSK